MLIEFKVANFQCFRDEVALSFQPGGRDTKLQGNIWQGHRYRALKSAAIFGPNASGKTSLLDALSTLCEFVGDSATRMNVGDLITNMRPFRLSGATRNEPCCFEVLVELDGTGYCYRVEATRRRVHREVLQRQDAASGSAWLTLIDRDASQRRCVLHDRMGSDSRRSQIIEDTRDNGLILSRAAERNVEPVVPLFKWFSQSVRHLQAGVGSPPDAIQLGPIARQAADDPRLMKQLSDFVRDADTGIRRVGTETDPQATDGFVVDDADELPSKLREAVNAYKEATKQLRQMLEDTSAKSDDDVSLEAFRFFTEHRDAEENPVRFSLHDESAGTLRYLNLVARLLRHCASPDLLVVDELHTSLHPQLARRVVQMAHSPEFGNAGAQLLFTTHDATLLDPGLLRRDQIFLTQKGPDGAVELYSLWDFEDMPRNTAAWGRNYLAGRFGGVPIFGPSLADIPQADKPTPVQCQTPATTEAE